MLYKNVSNGSIAGVIKDVDTKTGTVTGYFSIFGNVDSDGDMIMPGAFKRSLNNNYRRIKHLNQHISYQPLSGTKDGRLVLKEDAKGLYFESQISQTSYGKDVILLYQDGVVDEHSIGFETLKSRDSDTQTVMMWGKEMPVKELHECKLWEGSTVTWGANAMAQTESVKRMTKEQTFDRMQSVLKAIKNGTFENEEVFDMLELYFEQLKQHIIDLTEKSTQPETIVSPDSQIEKAEEISADEIIGFLRLKENILHQTIKA